MVKAGLRLRVLPQTRGGCVDGPRPCPYVSCRHHLLVDAWSDGRDRIKKARDFDENDEDSVAQALYEMDETCALDVADRGGISEKEVAHLVGMSREEVNRLVAGVADRNALERADFEEREHPEDFYLRYSQMGANELAEITAVLRARGKAKR